MVEEEEEENDETMAGGVEVEDGGVQMDGEYNPPDELRYNGYDNKNHCINREHAEEIFEASNRKISKVRIKRRNTSAQSNIQAKRINLSCTAHPQFRALNLKHKSDVHSPPGANRRKKRESTALAAVVQPTTKWDSVPRHW